MTSPGKILIVDDSEESLKLLSGTLSAEGYDYVGGLSFEGYWALRASGL